LAILGASRIDDAGDPPNEVSGLAPQRRRTIGVGDVVGGEDGVADLLEPVELVKVGVELTFSVPSE
jgi:hypothetical protein